MSLASYQGWEVGTKTVPLTGPKVYQCVVDAAPYRWQQQQHQLRSHHNQAESTKGYVPTLSVYIQHSNSSESSPEPTCKSSLTESTGVTTGLPPSSSSVSSSTLRQHGGCGPVSSYVLPSLAGYPGSERVSLIGEELELVNNRLTSGRSDSLGWSNGISSQRCGRNGGLLKVHPHDHEDNGLDSCGRGGSKPLPNGITGVLPNGLSKDCPEVPATVLFEGCEGPALSSSSSSIGVAEVSGFSSDGSEDNAGDGEVQSALRTAPLSTLAALEDSLPIKRGLSRYFTGQSKSFGCLSDALSTNLAKPANPYSRRRKNFVLCDDRQRTCPPVSRKSASGISKKNSFGNRSNLALAVAMEAAQHEDDYDNDDEDEDEDDDDYEEEDNDHPTPLPRMGLGGLYSNTNGAPSRSYSLSDLQGAVPPTRAFSFSDLQGAARN